MRKTLQLLNPYLGLDNTGHSFTSKNNQLQRMENLVYVDKTDLSTEGIGYTQTVDRFVGASGFLGFARYDDDTMLISNSKGIVWLNQAENTYELISPSTTDTLRPSARLNNDLVIPTDKRLLVWDGTTLSVNPISSSTCKAAAVFNNRVIYAGFSDAPNKVLVSDLNNAITADILGSDPNDGFEVTVDPSTNDEIVGVTTVYAKASNQQFAVIFKRNAIYLMQGSTQDTVTVTKIYEGYGTFNANSVAQVGSDVYFINEQGFFSLTSTIENGDMQVNVVDTDSVEDSWKLITANPEKVELALSPTEREIWMTVPDVLGNPKSMLVYSYDRRIRVKDTTVVLPYWTCFSPYKFRGIHAVGAKTYGFNKDGVLHELRTGNLFGNNTPKWNLHIPNLNAAALNRHKRFDFASIMLKVARYPTFTVDWNWREGNGSQSYQQRFVRKDPAADFISRQTIPASQVDKDAFLERYALPTGGTVGKYFYGWGTYGTAYYAEVEIPTINNEYNSSYYGSSSYTSFKNNLARFNARGLGMGQMLSLTLNGEGSAINPPRLSGLSVEVEYGAKNTGDQ